MRRTLNKRYVSSWLLPRVKAVGGEVMVLGIILLEARKILVCYGELPVTLGSVWDHMNFFI